MKKLIFKKKLKIKKMETICDTHFSYAIFPHFESDTIEFKKNINLQCVEKYYETICAFLNSSGGILIFGINDNREVIGISSENIDDLKLAIDSIYHEKKIIDNDLNLLKINNIKTKIIKNNIGKTIFLIKVNKIDSDTKYQLSNGKIFYRLNASNYFHKKEKIYKESEVFNRINLKNLETEKMIDSFRKEITNLTNINKHIQTENEKKDKEILEKNIQIQNLYTKLKNIYKFCFPVIYILGI